MVASAKVTVDSKRTCDATLAALAMEAATNGASAQTAIKILSSEVTPQKIDMPRQKIDICLLWDLRVSLSQGVD